MSFFVRDGDEVVCTLPPEYATVLRSMVGEVGRLLGHPVDRADPGLARLFPDVYSDADDSAEFRRLTESDLRTGKVDAAEVVLAAVPEGGGEVRLADADAAAWLRALNDVRLLVGTRLELTDDTDLIAELDQQVSSDPSSPRAAQLAVYGFLTELQGTLIEALGE